MAPTTAALTGLALLAFAANSLLCRLALAEHAIDAGSFTVIRLASGALVLALLVRTASGSWAPLRWRGAAGPLALLLYALPFSYAYLRIGAATGALVLFGSVQLTMLGTAIARGERPRPVAWLGFAFAVSGLAWLLGPSTQRPDLLGVAQMTIAGIAWGTYTVLGRGAGDPIAANARSFLWSCPLALVVVFAVPTDVPNGPRGILLAIVSGAITSGLGYAVWYRVLPRLTVSQAAVCQLSVPVLAAVGAVVLLDEGLTVRLLVAGTAVLGGVGLVLASRSLPR